MMLLAQMLSGQSVVRPWPQVETLRAAFPAQAARRAVSGAMDVTRHCTDYRGAAPSAQREERKVAPLFFLLLACIR
jgi:hypothetical protein